MRLVAQGPHLTGFIGSFPPLTDRLAKLREEYAQLDPDSAEGKSVAFAIGRMLRRMVIEGA